MLDEGLNPDHVFQSYYKKKQIMRCISLFRLTRYNGFQLKNTFYSFLFTSHFVFAIITIEEIS